MNNNINYTLSTFEEPNVNLKPCPFCGCNPTLYKTTYGNYWISCICSCQYGFTGSFTKDEVIQKWNNRKEI